MPTSAPAASHQPGRRRALVHGLAAIAALHGISSPARAQSPAGLVADKLHIFIPANPGGGWDQTGRALGAALTAAGAVREVSYENVGGKGGTIGLEAFVQKHNADPNALLITGTVMVGAVALRKPAVDFSHVQPLARLTSEYLTVAVAADSPIRNAQDLVTAMRQNLANLPVAGGSAGGVDHLFAGMLIRTAKAPVDQFVYQPYASGPEVAKAVIDKRAAVGISGYSEMSEALASGQLRAIGISSRQNLFGLASLRSQGVDADIANWRGVLTGKQVPPERAQALTAAIQRATQQDLWQSVLKTNRWNAAWLEGRAVNDQIEMDLATAQIMSFLLKLKAS